MILKQLNDIEKRITDMQQMLLVFNSQKNIRRGVGNDINGLLRFETKKTLKIFGTRWIGFGCHKVEFELPYDMVEPLEKLIASQILKLKYEYEQLKEKL